MAFSTIFQKLPPPHSKRVLPPHHEGLHAFWIERGTKAAWGSSWQSGGNDGVNVCNATRNLKRWNSPSSPSPSHCVFGGLQLFGSRGIFQFPKNSKWSSVSQEEDRLLPLRPTSNLHHLSRLAASGSKGGCQLSVTSLSERRANSPLFAANFTRCLFSKCNLK